MAAGVKGIPEFFMGALIQDQRSCQASPVSFTLADSRLGAAHRQDSVSEGVPLIL